ncbi:uncharacterized protein F5147DRAFT_46026 [Suillus discolor]|uniref:Uncharacterized protein n=1 Tax=Suillus discolor TaxID=1912936 RepID=A0A9P7FBL4_9AGAM|nr:uncharacterized protein F5147DRAFT_46026 [Suillus discolor]KAG2113442.1 hypothetical protein F5147DRAFT_46026 [Suillus discolor]
MSLSWFGLILLHRMRTIYIGQTPCLSSGTSNKGKLKTCKLSGTCWFYTQALVHCSLPSPDVLVSDLTHHLYSDELQQSHHDALRTSPSFIRVERVYQQYALIWIS